MYFYLLPYHYHNYMLPPVQQLKFATVLIWSLAVAAENLVFRDELCFVAPFVLHAEAGLASLRQKGALVLELMCNQPSWSLEEAGSPAEEQQNNVQQIQAVMEEMQLRKQR